MGLEEGMKFKKKVVKNQKPRNLDFEIPEINLEGEVEVQGVPAPRKVAPTENYGSGKSIKAKNKLKIPIIKLKDIN